MVKIYCINKNELKDDAYLNSHLDISNLDKRLEKQARDYLLDYVFNIYDINKSDYRVSEKGKPYIENNKIYFNISHSNELVFIGVSDNEIGIDLEYINKMDVLRIEKLMNKISNEEDYNFFYIDECYTLKYIWTIKEAYLKYKGIGLINDFKSIVIDYENFIVNDCIYKMCLLDDYILTIVSDKDELKIEFEWVK